MSELPPKDPAPADDAAEAEPGGTGGSRVRITAKARTPVVTVIGPPAELTMWALGRTAAARVRLEGSEADVKVLTAARWHL